MNAYLSVDALKLSPNLNLTTTDAAVLARLRRLIEAVSRELDNWCARHFYVRTATLLFDGEGSQVQYVPDLVLVTTLKTDDDLNRTFEDTWAVTDYLLEPANADPATRVNSHSKPYDRVVVDTDNGTKGHFLKARRHIQIVGEWGYWKHLKRATETASAIANATTTTVALSARTDIEQGHTILIESEQMYVESYSGNNLTVVRGVNGTTAAAHSGTLAIDIYEYPAPIVEAVLAQTERLFQRGKGGYTGVSGVLDGIVGVPAGLDRDVRQMLDTFRRMDFA